MDRVSTGSGSDLVSDQHAIFLAIFDFHGLTRSLPLPVLTRSKCDSYFWGKAIQAQQPLTFEARSQDYKSYKAAFSIKPFQRIIGPLKRVETLSGFPILKRFPLNL